MIDVRLAANRASRAKTGMPGRGLSGCGASLSCNVNDVAGSSLSTNENVAGARCTSCVAEIRYAQRLLQQGKSGMPASVSNKASGAFGQRSARLHQIPAT
ncbi:hypothetical protein AAIO65_11095 [Erwinia amylovora]|uniref:Uncharacterized protein n=1 Tax=Erwinia amylovora ATCC BAA-2158 TaxID=889211 RepID=E5B3N5_ERWAM|nr:hypothetical protein [Erwinia amylovora]CBX80088.1 hypothetical protein EAIL5_1268 [Erwinia amylovora ATCC BAA-2158]